MTGAALKATLDDAAFAADVAKLGGVLRVGVLWAVGAGLVKVVDQRFRDQKDPDGKRWHALLDGYRVIKKTTTILTESGRLDRSMTFSVSGNQVTVGSNAIYAGVHQFGATIKPVNAKALVFMLGVGATARGNIKTGLIHVKSVTIPARPYLGFGAADQREVLEVVAGFVRREFVS